MAKMWCIKCQREVEHEYIHCHGACNNNCEHRCSVCKLQTLANIRINPADTGNAAIKQAVGEAQRKAQRDGLTGEVEIEMWDGNSDTGTLEYKILVYNASTKQYSVRRI